MEEMKINIAVFVSHGGSGSKRNRRYNFLVEVIADIVNGKIALG